MSKNRPFRRLPDICCLCQKEVKESDKVVTWKDDVCGVKHIVHSTCTTDEKLIGGYNDGLAQFAYGNN